MKTKKRIVAFVVALAMCVTNFSMVTFAAEGEDMTSNAKVISIEEMEDGRVRYEMELTPQSTDENGVSTYALIQSSFTMTGSYYRGADRKYSGNYLNYTLEVTGADGNPQYNKQIQAQLWDYNSNCLSITTVTADGSGTTVPNIKIVPNRTYYFKYYLVTGSSSNLRVTMYFDTWG